MPRRTSPTNTSRWGAPSSELHLTQGNVQVLGGLRFQGVDIPTGARVTSAFIQFTAAHSASAATNLQLAGQLADNPPTFGGAVGNLSGRALTAAVVAWTPPLWTA